MDSNQRYTPYEGAALAAMLHCHKMVGKEGIEPTQPMAPDLQSGVTLQLHRLPTLFVIVSSLFNQADCPFFVKSIGTEISRIFSMPSGSLVAPS